MNKADNPQEEADSLALSALWDGEASDAQVDGVVAAYKADPQTMARWRSYALVGDVLRGTPAHPGADRVAATMAAIRAQASLPAPPPSVAPVAAANDPLWTWKLVAGVASVTAVGALAWGLLRSAPDPVGAQSVWAVQSTGSAAPVVASGAMLRNPELEALLAEHRQHGGMSAVQLSAGFLRNATYELPAGR